MGLDVLLWGIDRDSKSMRECVHVRRCVCVCCLSGDVSPAARAVCVCGRGWQLGLAHLPRGRRSFLSKKEGGGSGDRRRIEAAETRSRSRTTKHTRAGDGDRQAGPRTLNPEVPLTDPRRSKMIPTKLLQTAPDCSSHVLQVPAFPNRRSPPALGPESHFAQSRLAIPVPRFERIATRRPSFQAS